MILDDKEWEAYFRSISKVCPWSLDAYMDGRIRIEQYDPEQMAWEDMHWISHPEHGMSAIIWVNAPNDPDLLDEIVQDWNQSEFCTYFWSHPAHTKGGNNQTAMPCIIQQDTQQLTAARSSLNKHK